MPDLKKFESYDEVENALESGLLTEVQARQAKIWIDRQEGGRVR